MLACHNKQNVPLEIHFSWLIPMTTASAVTLLTVLKTNEYSALEYIDMSVSIRIILSFILLYRFNLLSQS